MRIKLNVFFILFLFASYFIGWLPNSIILFVSVLLHEFGHVITARKLGIKVYEVELLPYGGVARTEELSKLGGIKETVVSIAGPAASLITALICLIPKGYPELFDLGFKYNIVLCIFNILPMVPLDGGRIARNLLCFFIGYRQATKILVYIGRLAAFSMLGYNIYMLFFGGKSAAYAIAACFIYIGTVKEEKNSSYFYLFTGNSTKNKLIRQGRIRKRFINAYEDSRISSVINQFSPMTQCFVQVRDTSGTVKRVLNEDEITAGLLKYGYDGIIRQITEI